MKKQIEILWNAFKNHYWNTETSRSHQPMETKEEKTVNS